MKFDLQAALAEERIEVSGVLHVGAHRGQEVGMYRRLGARLVVLCDPLPGIMDQARLEFGEAVQIHECAIGSRNEFRTLYVDEGNDGQSSSLLRPKQHLVCYPSITFPTSITVEVRTVDALSVPPDINLLVIDVQGFEAEVLDGARSLLQRQIAAVATEVNSVELYEGCALVEQIDHRMNELGFRRTVTAWAAEGWGDALYTRP